MDLHLVGGFLGSGKTTAIIAAARILAARGLSVGVVTNHQGKALVDTAFFRSAQLPAVEVAGGCFCCRYDDLAARLEQLRGTASPQVIFAESVGSCADLVAAVVNPLRALHAEFAPASFSVFTDCRLLLRRLRGEELPLSDALVYIFDQQIEEAGLLVVNKVDLLERAVREELRGLVERRWPGRRVLLHSALVALTPGPSPTGRGEKAEPWYGRGEKTEPWYGRGEKAEPWYGRGENVEIRSGSPASSNERGETAETRSGSPASSDGRGEECNDWLASIEGGEMERGMPLQIDYARYGAAEARLAWLDMGLTLTSPQGDARPAVVRLLEGMRARLAQRGAGLAHLKVVLSGTGGELKVSLTALDGVEWQAQLGDWRAGESVRVILNAHAEIDPAGLEDAARAALAGCGAGCALEWIEARAPGFPHPTHRTG